MEGYEKPSTRIMKAIQEMEDRLRDLEDRVLDMEDFDEE